MLQSEDGGLPVARDGLEELDERGAVDIASQFGAGSRDAERGGPCEDAGDPGDELADLERAGHHIGGTGGLRGGGKAGITAVRDDDDGEVAALRLDLGKEGERRTIREPGLGENEGRRGRAERDGGRSQAGNTADGVAGLAQA